MIELLIIDGPEAGRRLPLGTEPLLLGRSSSATFSFPADNYMSGLHLQALKTPAGVLVTDLSSTNGTFVNGQRVHQTVAVVGDLIRLGMLSMKVVPSEVATGESAGAVPTRETPVFSSSSAHPSGPVLSSPPPDEIMPNLSAANYGVLLQSLQTHGDSIFCLVDAAVDPAIYALLLAGAERVPVRCLYDGESAATLANWAPYLVSVGPDSPLLHTLIQRGWGKGWASYLISTASFEELRHHFRRFLMVQLEQGPQVYFRFYDPRVLRDFLPTATADELNTFFGPVSEWIVESADSKRALRMRCSQDGLLTTVLSLMDSTR